MVTESGFSPPVVVTRVDYLTMSRSKSMIKTTFLISFYDVGNRGRVQPMHMLVDIFHAMGVG